MPIAAERPRINDLYRAGELKDDLRGRIERNLHMREVFSSDQGCAWNQNVPTAITT